MDIAVLGGGITGCVFAAEMAGDSRFHIDLFERSGRLGGLHHSLVIDNLAYDIGAFFFESNHKVFETFPELASLFVEISAKRLTVSDEGKIDGYPLTLKGYMRNHGFAHFALALGDAVASRVRYRRRGSLPDFIKYYIGGTVYERSGLRTYIERLYNLPADQIHLAFAEQRLSSVAEKASLRSIVRRLIAHPSKMFNEGHYERTVLARPKAGFAAMYDHMESALRVCGVNVYKDANVSEIAREGDGFRLKLPEGNRYYDRVVSTAPIPVTARLLGIPLEHRFDTVSLLTLFYRFRGIAGYDADVLSNFSHSGDWKRIIDFSQLYGGQDVHWLSVEVPMARPADVSKTARQFEEHVRGLGLFNGDLNFQSHAITPNAYPVYRAGGIEKLTLDKERILASGVVLAGRQGEFGYVSSDQAAHNAAELARGMKANPTSI